MSERPLSISEIKALEAQLAEVVRLDWPGVPVRVETMLALIAAARRASELDAENERLRFSIEYAAQMAADRRFIQDYLTAALAAPSEEKP